MVKKLLVTGGAGFIGSNFIHHMLQSYDDVQVTNLDLLTYAGNLDNLTVVETDSRYEFIKGDITNFTLLCDILKTEYDAVVNFAAESHVDRSIEDPGIFVRTNVLGTQSLLEAARRNGVKKFLQVSTDEVYGSLGEEGFFTETTTLNPSSPYSASKAAADHLVMAYGHTFGMHVNITRCSNNYGPYQFPEKLIPLMVTNAMEDKALPVYGDGLNIRDWLHVKDHCRAIDKVLRAANAGEVYNIGGNHEKKNIDIVKIILNQMGKSENLITYVQDRLGHDRRYAIDATKIKRDLEWEPEYTFERGMAETVDWYRKNKEWWQKIKSGEYLHYYERMYANL